MMEFIGNLFNANFMPHGYCFLWFPEILWLHVVSDGLIALSYFMIPTTLLYLVWKRQEVPFRWMLIMFSAFILACGTTHLMHIGTIWNGNYGLEGIVKLFTAGISLATAGALMPLLPKALALRSPAELEALNRTLQKEILEREKAQAALRKAHDELELRVQERTADLVKANQRLERQIAARQGAEKALAESETRYRLLAQHSTDMISRHAPDGVYLYASPACQTLLGYSAEELVGRSAYDFFYPEDLPSIKQAHTTILEQPVVHTLSYRIRRKDGKHIWFETTAKTVRNGKHNAVQEIIANSRDITDRKQAEERARMLQTELTHRARLSLAGEMASGLAHEINQPLTAIVTYTDTALRMLRAGKAEPETLIGIIEKVSAQGLRAGEIIHRLRNFVRKTKPHRSKVAINELIREVASLAAAEARAHSITMELDLADPMPLVYGDNIQIQQVILNLVHNSIEAMQENEPQHRRLILRTSLTADDNIEVAVADTGPGLSIEAMNELFQPFFTTKTTGMGLGLSISQSIVEAHAGKLWATPNPERGVTFHFTLSARGAGNQNEEG